MVDSPANFSKSSRPGLKVEKMKDQRSGKTPIDRGKEKHLRGSSRIGLAKTEVISKQRG